MKNITKKIIVLTFVIVLLLSYFSVVFAVDGVSAFSDEEIEWLNNLKASNTNYKKFFMHHNNGQTIVYFINSIYSSDKFYLSGTSLTCSNSSLTWYKYIYPNITLDWSGSSSSRHSKFNSNNDRYCSDIIYTDSSLTNISYSVFVNPYVANTAEDLSTGKFNSILIIPNDAKELGIKIHKINKSKADINNDGIDEDVETFETLYSKNLDDNYINSLDDNVWYEIPFDDLSINFNNDITYVLELVNDVNKIYLDDTYKLYYDVRFTIGGLTAEDIEANRHQELINSNNKIQDVIKENTETNKSILSKIGDILSYINPFSENFFGKKLIDLLIEGLKSLFVPSDDFFSNWFDDFNSWLGDRFGILYYPIEIVLDFLNRFASLNETTECKITIPAMNINFFGNTYTVFNGYVYDFNDLLTNDTFKNVHTVYLTIVDVIMYLWLIILAYNSFSEVFGGRFIDEVVSDASSDERSYNNYKRYQSNKDRYKSEKGSK